MAKEENGGIPDSSGEFDSTQCAGLVKMNKDDSYHKKEVKKFTNVDKSGEGKSPVVVKGKTCYTVKNQDSSNAFLTANFGKEEEIYQI
mgnify:CR=1 FL=1